MYFERNDAIGAQRARRADPADDRWPWVWLVTLVLVGLLMVGGARDDLVSLLLWRPLSALLLVYGIYAGLGQTLAIARPLLLWFAAAAVMILLHLVPLPPALWTALPGRDLIVAVYRDAGMSLPWRPLTMVSAGSWNAFFALMAPAAALLLAARLSASRQRQLLMLLIGAGLVSGLIGLLQVLGSANGPLYFYRITNRGEAVGIFANRNHHAMFLVALLPMLAAFYAISPVRRDLVRIWQVVLFSAAAFIVPVLLATGSRAGLLLLPVALLLAWWTYTPPELVGRRIDRPTSGFVMPLLVMAGLAVVGMGAFIAGSADAIDRLLANDVAADRRAQSLPVLIDAIWRFFPFGSGIGSFPEVYKAIEPASLLELTYLNHAHNDLVEIAMTAGLPGLLLIGAAALLWVGGVYRLLRMPGEGRRQPTAALGRCGASIIMLLALGSIADYPLRVPSLAVLAALAAVWMALAVSNAAPARRGGPAT